MFGIFYKVTMETSQGSQHGWQGSHVLQCECVLLLLSTAQSAYWLGAGPGRPVLSTTFTIQLPHETFHMLLP